MRKILLAMGVISVLLASRGVAEAQLTVAPARVTNEPAATLLLPYFEVELPKKIGGTSKGITTLFTVNNASATAVLAHVTVWSDLAVPVTNFNIYLTGYDTQTVNLFDVLNGHLPRTGSDGQDPQDTISKQGPISQDINFASCSGQLPYPDPIPEESTQHLRSSLTGQPSALFGGKCSGRALGDKRPIARGFITIDTVNNCTLRFPGDPGYFNFGDVTNQNVLWGDYVLINKSKKVARGDALVHIQASSTDPLTANAGNYTFYQSLDANDSTDFRQPLATIYAGRFVNVPKHPVFPTGTSVIAWRDCKVKQVPFTCGALPSPFPLSEESVVVFDEQENPEIPVLPPIPPFPATDIMPFPAATQIVKVGGSALPVATTSGWILFNMNTTVAGVNAPATDPAAAQATMTMVLDSKGKYSAAYRAVNLDSATDTNSSHSSF
ncbi:MAG: hypothetical protein ABIR79_20725 [Candidatus Binatia bacterium]